MSTRPLADEIRPQSLDEVVGQRHLIGPGGVLRRLIDAGALPRLPRRRAEQRLEMPCRARAT